MKKRLVGVALCIVMLASVLPLSAFAASVETDGDESACTCEVACDASAMNAECAVCSAPDAPVTVCAKYSSQITDATAAQPAAENADSTAAPAEGGAATPAADVADPSTHTHTQTGNEAVTEPGEAVAAVQKMIDVLPTPEQFAAMDEAAQATAYDAAQAAADAYDALTPAEQQQLNSAALMALHEYFNNLLAVGDKIDYTDDQINKVTVTGNTYTYAPYVKNNVTSEEIVEYTDDAIKQQIVGIVTIDDDAGLGSKLVFRLGEEEKYSSDKPKQSEVGKYKIYWYIKGDETHNDYWPNPAFVESEIKPFEIGSANNKAVITVGNNAKSKSYDGDTKMLNEQDVSLGIRLQDMSQAIYYILKLRYGEDYNVTGVYEDKNVGTGKQLTVKITLKSNSFKFAAGDNVSDDGKTYTYMVNDAEITQAPPTVTATVKTAYVGDAVPSLASPVLGTDYTLTGLASGDNVNVTLKYYDSTGTNEVTPDMTRPGEYIIRPTVTVAGDNDADNTLNNYSVELKDGKLTVAEKPTHTITATAGANGTISPVGAVKVKHGETQSFKITPASGYVVASVRVDGVNLGSLASYTFTDVNTDHTISATFMLPWGNPQTGVDVG